jgi:hypothetical protein
MPVHGWTKVDDGIFHDFHCAWIIHLKESLNEGVLPDGYYAIAEQHARDRIPDVLKLRAPIVIRHRTALLPIEGLHWPTLLLELVESWSRTWRLPITRDVVR